MAAQVEVVNYKPPTPTVVFPLLLTSLALSSCCRLSGGRSVGRFPLRPAAAEEQDVRNLVLILLCWWRAK